jgi:hypothetical protein
MSIAPKSLSRRSGVITEVVGAEQTADMISVRYIASETRETILPCVEYETSLYPLGNNDKRVAEAIVSGAHPSQRP